MCGCELGRFTRKVSSPPWRFGKTLALGLLGCRLGCKGFTGVAYSFCGIRRDQGFTISGVGMGGLEGMQGTCLGIRPDELRFLRQIPTAELHSLK